MQGGRIGTDVKGREASAIVGVLQSTELLSGIPADDLQVLAGGLTLRRYPHQQAVGRTSDISSGLLVVSEGTVRLFRSSAEGREVTLDIFGPGEAFGLSTYGPVVHRESELRAGSSGAVVCDIARSRLQAFFESHPCVAMRAVDLLGRRMALLCDRMEDIALYRVRSRVAHELARQVALRRTNVISLTRDELAALVGASPSDVSRAISAFRQEHLIASTPYRPGIRVLDVTALATSGARRSPTDSAAVCAFA
jgi:CRP-like cAMP-binding protein